LSFSLGTVYLFKFHWRQIPQRGVQRLVVIDCLEKMADAGTSLGEALVLEEVDPLMF
jgi:hypothetical protein